MQPKQVDLFIIGGGINGVGVAADAAGRGLSVILCEKDDLASHTSSASTKLIHGGLRYLEQYDFKLVREALREREILLHNAPHLVHPLEFVLPHDAHLRPAWIIRLGLLLYDYLSNRKILTRSHQINFKTDKRGHPLQEKFIRGFSYMDCQTDDARLVVANAMQAKQRGAVILTQTEVIKLQRISPGWQITVKYKNTEKCEHFIAKGVINAAGSWVVDILKIQASITTSLQIKWVKGSHFIVPKLYPGDFAFILQNKDQRIVFVIPYQQHYSLIGTTDVVYNGDPNHVRISDQEIEYLIQIVNEYLKARIKREHIVWSYAGIRSLYDDTKNKNPSKMTREYHLELMDEGGQYPLLSIFGGKLTTYRRLAEHVLEKLAPYYPTMGKPWTCNAFLPGGDLGGVDFSDFVIQLKQHYHQLPDRLLQRLAKNYGALCYEILKNAKTTADLGIAFSADLYEAEVKHLLMREWATSCDDILWRRTKLGITLLPDEINRLTDFCCLQRTFARNS